MRFRKVAVGGTFDRLHDGHRALIGKAFEVGESVIIGVCSDEMQLTRDSAGVEPFEARRSALEGFLSERGWLGRAEVVAISDPFGPAAEDAELEAIVVSPETRPRAEVLNEIRSSRGLAPLEIIEIPFVLAEDGTPISSIRIRYGEMDERGRVVKRSVI